MGNWPPAVFATCLSNTMRSSGAAAGGLRSKSPDGGYPPGSVAAERPGVGSTHIRRRRRRTAGPSVAPFLGAPHARCPCRGNNSVCWPARSQIGLECGSYVSPTPERMPRWSAIALREQIARKLLSRPRSATRSAKSYGLSVCGRPADQARVARSRTALRLPGGDIFLDLLSPDIGKSVPVRSEGQITSAGIGGRRGQTR
jgi:hypothetical protein